MTTTRRQYSPKFKARVAVEAIRGERTLGQLGSQFKVHPIQIAKWRKAALEQLPELFVDGRTRKGRNGEADSDALYARARGLFVVLRRLGNHAAGQPRVGASQKRILVLGRRRQGRFGRFQRRGVFASAKERD